MSFDDRKLEIALLLSEELTEIDRIENLSLKAFNMLLELNLSIAKDLISQENVEELLCLERTKRGMK